MIWAQRMLSKGTIPFIALTMSLVVSGGAYALGLGEARVESFLNQPLDVRMRLLDVSEDDLDSLSVTPASPEDFERLGLTGTSLALSIEIEVDRSASPPVIHITTTQPVSDPVVQLLLDARWASGRLLREYTLFLDPPTIAVEAPAPASAQPTRQPETADRADAEPARPAPARPAPVDPVEAPRTQQSRPVAASGSRSYGPVASGETLWSIARANLPAGEITMNQMMIAIVELNPSAFRNRNINQLLRGAELQLPDAEQARALDAAAAAAEVAAQNRAFSRGVNSDVPVVSSAGRDSGPAGETSAVADVAARPEQTESVDPVDHRLSLVPPGDEESGSGLSEDAAEVADLRQRLARAEEELYAARQEAEEFQARVENLEAAVLQNPGGIGLRDAELAGLEATLRAAREATREDADPQLRAQVSERLGDYLEQYEAAAREGEGGGQVASRELASGSDESLRNDGAESGTPAENGLSETDAAPAGADATPAPERAVTETEASRGLLANPIVLLAVGLVVLLAILGITWFALRRGRESAEPKTPLKRGADLPKPARAIEDPVQAARARVRANPEDLAAHLGLLQTLATDDHHDDFGEALESMYAHVESDSESEWREALALASRVVPGHSLIKGGADWDSKAPERKSDEPPSEIDEESEVDDLMTRLDADPDESDDRDWLGKDDHDEPKEYNAPLLDDDEYDNGDLDMSSGAEESEARSDELDEEIDFGDWADDEETSDDAVGLSPPAEGQETDEDEDGDLELGWSDEEKSAGQAESGAKSSAQSDPGNDRDDDSDYATDDGREQSPAEEDIFAPSDDDIDVKLDLAKAYLSWNSTDSARTLLEEVVREGNDSQREEARKLLDDLSDSS